MKEFHREDFANRTGLAQAWTVKSADRLFTNPMMGGDLLALGLRRLPPVRKVVAGAGYFVICLVDCRLLFWF